jgi:(p)ppGpp synthase/HD superfamily hydrolase
MRQDFEKQKMAIRYWMLGKGYYMAVKAMDIAENHHTGKRKDGNHEFSHQVSQANFARTLVSTFDNPEVVLAVIFLHDTIEDYGESYQRISSECGKEVADAVLIMSKVVNGHKIGNVEYYRMLSESPAASLAKGFDRLHNLMTMLGGFKPEKQVRYIKETMEFVVPMLKQARRKFPTQEAAYENIKFVMTNQVIMYNELNKDLVIAELST